MKGIGHILKVTGHSDFACTDGRRAWLWRYWPARTELVASVYHRGLPWVLVRDLLFQEERRQVAERVKVSAQGLPDIEPLAEGGEWATKYPKLTSYLVDCTFTDGSVRLPSKLFIRVERGKWVVELKEPNQGLKLEVVTQLPSEMMTALEAALSDAKPPWRVDQWAAMKGKKSKR